MKKTNPILALALLVTALFSGCAKDGPEVATNPEDYRIISGKVNRDGSSFKGSGSVIFRSSLSGVKSSQNYFVRFNLQDGGSLRLISNASNQLAGGASIVFSRNGTQLRVAIEGDGKSYSYDDKFTAVDASQTLGYWIDVHNSHGHWIIWPDSTTLFDEDSAQAIEEDGPLGTGSFWGLTLDRATVLESAVGSVKHSH